MRAVLKGGCEEERKKKVLGTQKKDGVGGPRGWYGERSTEWSRGMFFLVGIKEKSSRTVAKVYLVSHLNAGGGHCQYLLKTRCIIAR